MNREDFKKKYSSEIYLGDGLYVRFDGYHFVVITKRENGTHRVGLESHVFERLLDYRKKVYEEAKQIKDEPECATALQE